ncbi:MAG TPA: radical SAM protein [Dehalococcoidia bacterium]|nr:radical SAM protein [Dehalococcoidia bacterium]
MNPLQPSYISLYKCGELEKRAERLWQRLASCDICPRECGVDRLAGEKGFCHSGYKPIVASVCDHHGEEPVLSDRRGSGTIFFGNCNLRCRYCQNHQISQDYEAQKANETDCHSLARCMLHLQNDLGCHNINLVSPSHFVPQIVKALLEAIPMGLKVPLVYNTNAYDSLKTLRELDGVIDIYLPDLKYASDDYARKFSRAHEYVHHSRNAVKEMYRQVGELVVDESGIARRGLIVRHLILPNRIAGSRESLLWLSREVSPRVAVSLMSQYHPMHKAYKHELLSRPIRLSEYNEALQAMEAAGLEEGWAQKLTSHRNYLPDFERDDHPFRLGV